MTEKCWNFKEGEIWLSKKRKKFKIILIDTNSPDTWYPLLLENTESKILFTADSDGSIYSEFKFLEDKLIMKVSEEFSLKKDEKDLASRMLKVYNKRNKMMEEDRKQNNRKVKRLYRLGKPRDR